MPATKDAITRLSILDTLLSDKYHDYSLDDLTEEVNKKLSEINPEKNGVVRRTIEKDIQYLEYQSPFDVLIRRYSVSSYNYNNGRNYIKRCLQYENPSFSIFKKQLSDDEEYLLREVLSLLGQFDGLPNLDRLETLRCGLKLPNDNRKIISFTKNPLEGSNLLGEIFTAISNRQVIEIRYFKFSSPEKRISCVLHPYLLKEYNRRWYLLGATETDNTILTFSLDRIDKVKALPAHKYQDCDEDLNEYFDDIIGVTRYEGCPVEHILFWVSDVSKDYVRTKPLHDSQRHYKGNKENVFREMYPNLIGGYFFSVDCINNYELIRELCSFGSELAVLSPKSIRDEIYDRIINMKNRYDELLNFPPKTYEKKSLP